MILVQLCVNNGGRSADSTCVLYLCHNITAAAVSQSIWAVAELKDYD